MFPAVVVDLGSQVRPAEAAWVLSACNAAIIRGSCELEATPDAPARAVAIVRLRGRRTCVRIEVGLRDTERAAWSVREIEFSAKAPPRERWRTVGLALATLVGEVEAARAEEVGAGGATPGALEPAEPGAGEGRASSAGAAQTPAAPELSSQRPAEQAPAAAERAPAPSEPAEPEPAELEAPDAPLLEPAPVTGRVLREADAPGDVPPPFPRHHGVFVGLGVLASPAAAGSGTRWGGALRVGHSLPSGWVLALNADYSRAVFEPGDYALDTIKITPGVAYRLAPSEHWSIGLGVHAGVRALWASSARPGAEQQSAWSPFAAGSLELWWQVLPAGGLWGAGELGSIGRATRVRGPDSRLQAVVPPAELRAFFGLWAAL